MCLLSKHHLQSIKIFMKTLKAILTCLIFITCTTAAFAEPIYDKNFTGVQKEHYADGKPKYEVHIEKGKNRDLKRFGTLAAHYIFKPLIWMTKRTVFGSSGMKTGR